MGASRRKLKKRWLRWMRWSHRPSILYTGSPRGIGRALKKLSEWEFKKRWRLQDRGDLVCGQHGNPWPCDPCVKWSMQGNAVTFGPRGNR